MGANRIGQIGIPAAVVGIAVMMVVPLPTFLLDLLLVINITAAVLVLLISMQVRRPLEFAVFPSLLLVATMFRLALNVSSTRLILLNGFAGDVIQSFGDFVIGGSLVVGLVIFTILIVIQFIVITNGAGRVAEVAARFTLDAMPGKQMAIDADLNSGLIDEATARKRREEISAEADFYGAMDGASKFVKGDAIAGIVITLINLIGGFVVGVVQEGMPIQEAMSRYSLLTVGDGLVAQIPALLISISTGIIITRAATEGDMGSDLITQFARQRGSLQTGGIAACGLALVPGLPRVPFLIVGLTVFFLARRVPVVEPESNEPEEPELEPAISPDSPEAIAGEMFVEPLELEIAFDLIDLVDESSGGDLLERVRALRKKLALELGVVIPLVRTRDNLELPAQTYSVKVHGVEMAQGQAPRGMVLAIGDDLSGLPGTATVEPVFGLPARWVPLELRQQAELAGATVVDRSAVIITHLAEIVRDNASSLLGRQDLQALVDVVKTGHPSVVEEMTSQLSLSEVQGVLQALLEEQVSIRDLVRIFEVLSERSRSTKDREALTEAVRLVLGPAISASYATSGRLPAITIDPLVEHSIAETLRGGEHGTFLGLEPEQLERLSIDITRTVEQVEQTGVQPVILCSAPLRPALRRLVRTVVPRVPVLSYAELGSQLRVETVGVVNVADTAHV